VTESEKSREKQLKILASKGAFPFTGRDAEIGRIRKKLHDDSKPWLLLTGSGGVGKTELALAYARNQYEAGLLEGGAFITGFSTWADLGQAIGSISGFGSEFEKYSEDEQKEIIIRYLKENRTLLIWDNFESASGYRGDGNGAEDLAQKGEMNKLSDFLKKLKGGFSRVIIVTTNSEEPKLGIEPVVMEVGGLNETDSKGLIKGALAIVGIRPEQFEPDPEYKRLTEFLERHPRSLELVLPRLAEKTPGEILAGLEKIKGEASAGQSTGETCHEWALRQFPEKAQNHIAFLGLFSEYVSKLTLHQFFKIKERWEDSYLQVMGELISREDWDEILDEAMRNGLIRLKADGLYKIPRNTSLYLRQKLERVLGGGNKMRNLQNTMMEFYGRYAVSLFEKVQQGHPGILLIAGIEDENFLSSLRTAIREKNWLTAHKLLETLMEYYTHKNRTAEWRGLRNTSLEIIGLKPEIGDNRQKGDLWVFLVWEKAKELIEKGALAEGSKILETILKYLLSLNDHTLDSNIAVIYHRLGMVEERRKNFAESESLYKKSLELREKNGLMESVGATSLGLGILDTHRKKYSSAEKWYKKALDTFTMLGLEKDIAGACHNIGMLEMEKKNYGRAEKNYMKALTIYENTGNKIESASSCYHLGMANMKLKNFDEAELWFQKALDIFKSYSNPPMQVSVLQAMGLLKLGDGKNGEAILFTGRAYLIAAEYFMKETEDIITQLAEIFGVMGEEDFVDQWGLFLGGKTPPVEQIRIVNELNPPKKVSPKKSGKKKPTGKKKATKKKTKKKAAKKSAKKAAKKSGKKTVKKKTIKSKASKTKKKAKKKSSKKKTKKAAKKKAVKKKTTKKKPVKPKTSKPKKKAKKKKKKR
jgi:tetratricopeptide (TPR) repeat protein